MAVLLRRPLCHPYCPEQPSSSTGHPGTGHAPAPRCCRPRAVISASAATPYATAPTRAPASASPSTRPSPLPPSPVSVPLLDATGLFQLDKKGMTPVAHRRTRYPDFSLPPFPLSSSARSLCLTSTLHVLIHFFSPLLSLVFYRLHSPDRLLRPRASQTARTPHPPVHRHSDGSNRLTSQHRDRLLLSAEST